MTNNTTISKFLIIYGIVWAIFITACFIYALVMQSAVAFNNDAVSYINCAELNKPGSPSLIDPDLRYLCADELNANRFNESQYLKTLKQSQSN